MTSKIRLPKITAKQEDGDDGYCYVVRIDGIRFMAGLTRSELKHWKRQALEHWMDRNIVPTTDRKFLVEKAGL